MPWFFVRQPNGLLARFSTVVDAFCDVDMTETEALEYCSLYMGENDAKLKVRRGVEDRDRVTDVPGDGLHRWRECIDTMESVNRSSLELLRKEHPGIFSDQVGQVRQS